MSSIRVTKKELQKAETAHNKSTNCNDLLKYILEAIKEVVSSFIA